MKHLTQSLFWAAVLWLCAACAAAAPHNVGRLLYVAAPGVRNDLALGGAGILIFDIERGHRFVRRIETPASRAQKPENIKGICASAATGRLYVTTPTRIYCLDLVTEQPLWERALPGGCDRMAILPDGMLLYVPSFEGPAWNVVDGATGSVAATITTGSGAHNTVCGASGRHVYLAGLRSPLLSVASASRHQVVRDVGPFSAPIRPFTVDGAESRVFACVNDRLGFEIGDLKTGKVLAQVDVAGFEKGPVLRHGCPSHGIALTPNEREVWLCDAHNRRLHIFDISSAAPKRASSIALRDEPGWITFSIDGRYAYPSTGQVIDVLARRVVDQLMDEQDRMVQSEKLLEIVFAGGKPVSAGDQFGVGRKAQSVP